jgi:hypothetical protein
MSKACQVCQETVASKNICLSCADKFLPKQVGIAQFQRNYVDMALLVEAIKIYNASTITNQISWDTSNNKIKLYFSIYTMNPNGFHIGYEEYKAKLHIVSATLTEKNNTQKHEYSRLLVWVDDFDLECIDAPKTETCNCNDEDNCQCELYYSPLDTEDIDHAWQEFEEILDQILKTPLMWQFDQGIWRIINRATKKVIWSPE